MNGSIRKNKKWLSLLKIVKYNSNIIPYVQKYHKGIYYSEVFKDLEYLENIGLIETIDSFYYLTNRGELLMQKTKIIREQNY